MSTQTDPTKEQPFNIERLATSTPEELEALQDAELDYVDTIAPEVIPALRLRATATIAGTDEERRAHTRYLAEEFEQQARRLTSRGAERLFMLPMTDGQYRFLYLYLKFTGNPNAGQIINRATERDQYMERLGAALVLAKSVTQLAVEHADAGGDGSHGAAMTPYARLLAMRQRFYKQEIPD